MKKIYLSLLLVASLYTAQAQNTAFISTPQERLKHADQLFKRYEFVEAVEHYKKLVRGEKTDDYVALQLAESYYHLFNTVESAKWYAKAVELNPNQDAEVFYRYAQMLKASGRYDSSNKIMKKFADLKPEDSRAIDYLQNPDYIPALRSQEALFTFEDSRMNNSQFSDFGGILTTDNILYFASARDESKKKYGWNDQPFLNVYAATYVPDEEKFKDIKPVDELNTKHHDGPTTITADGQTMFFATESFRGGKYEKDKKNRLKKGKVSVYRAKYNGKKWTDIEPLPFNSPDYMVSNPAVTPDGKTLYFASDMPGTVGDMDIWRVDLNEDGTYGTPENMGTIVNTEGRESFPFVSEDGKLIFASNAHKGFGGLDLYMFDLTDPNAKVRNIGDPINTAKDDFHLSYYPEKGIGFLSTNRVGRDDIYKVRPVCVTEMVITVKDQKTGAILKDAQVAILDYDKNIIETRFTDAYGIVRYDTDCNKVFALQVEAEGYESKDVELQKWGNGKYPIDVELRPIEMIVIDKKIILGDIYFEFDKFNITQQGAFELNKLVQILQRNPTMKIKIESHTDNKGSDAYNLKLSDQRAQSTMQYVISKGISPARLQARGYGESSPKVDCGENCTQEQDAINRRSEFLITQE
ncbi:OmpA family protein [Flavobacterium dauae]|uniref:OmpA family protein n=1 Tax=Flavobacterium dauae TaxID=1563479 RepID=UPI00101B393C|nr:OmpA family protein [Flavobacterium dauae]WLD23588.1 OmpA family protein [Flavobacterium dauae]